MVARVADGGRGAEQLRARAMKARDAEEAPEDVGDMRAEDPPVDVQLVDDDVAEILQRARPARVMRQHPGVQHVGVREDDARPLASRTARVARRISVVDHGAGVRTGRAHELSQPGLLIPGQRLRRVEVDGSRVSAFGQRLEDRDVKAETLAARRRRGDHDMTAGQRGLDGARLVGIEAADTAPLERPADSRVEPGGQAAVGAVAPRERLIRTKTRLYVRAGQPPAKDCLDPDLLAPGGGRHAGMLNRCSPSWQPAGFAAAPQSVRSPTAP